MDETNHRRSFELRLSSRQDAWVRCISWGHHSTRLTSVALIFSPKCVYAPFAVHVNMRNTSAPAVLQSLRQHPYAFHAHLEAKSSNIEGCPELLQNKQKLDEGVALEDLLCGCCGYRNTSRRVLTGMFYFVCTPCYGSFMRFKNLPRRTCTLPREFGRGTCPCTGQIPPGHQHCAISKNTRGQQSNGLRQHVAHPTPALACPEGKNRDMLAVPPGAGLWARRAKVDCLATFIRAGVSTYPSHGGGRGVPEDHPSDEKNAREAPKTGDASRRKAK